MLTLMHTWNWSSRQCSRRWVDLCREFDFAMQLKASRVQISALEVPLFHDPQMLCSMILQAAAGGVENEMKDPSEVRFTHVQID